MPSETLPDNFYALPRDQPESSRLDEQHLIWKTNVGFLLHPRIAETLPSNARIADVATGTGVWLIDLANEQKSSKYKYNGLDMSSAQFPANPPENINFSTFNILDPVPESLKGQFDAIHLRLLVLGIPTGKWEFAARNLMELLRPGGWIQWEEANFANLNVFQNVPGASATAAKEFRRKIMESTAQNGKGHHETQILGSVMTSAGFEQCQEDLISSDRVSSTRDAFTQIGIKAMAGMMMMTAKEDGEGSYWGTPEAAALYAESAKETKDGKIYFQADIRVVTGRKPQ